MSAPDRNTQPHRTYHTSTKSSGDSSRQSDTQGLDALADAAASQRRVRSGARHSSAYPSSAHRGRTDLRDTDRTLPTRAETPWWMKDPPAVLPFDPCRESPRSETSSGLSERNKSDAPTVAPGKRRPSTNTALGHLRQKGGQGTTQSHANSDPHWTTPDEPGSGDEWWMICYDNLGSSSPKGMSQSP